MCRLLINAKDSNGGIMESKNIIIRPTEFDDCMHFAKWETDPDLTEFFSINDGQTYEDIVTKYIRSKSNPSEEIYTIVHKEDMRPIGQIHVGLINNVYDSLDITRIYIAEKEKRGNGLGEETMRLFLEHCFLTMHRERVTLDYFSGNVIALALYQKLGFHSEGIMRHAAKKNGKYYDLHLMSMLKTEFYSKLHRN